VVVWPCGASVNFCEARNNAKRQDLGARDIAIVAETIDFYFMLSDCGCGPRYWMGDGEIVKSRARSGVLLVPGHIVRPTYKLSLYNYV
jgi:hypothetical protein